MSQLPSLLLGSICTDIFSTCVLFNDSLEVLAKYLRLYNFFFKGTFIKWYDICHTAVFPVYFWSKCNSFLPRESPLLYQ